MNICWDDPVKRARTVNFTTFGKVRIFLDLQGQGHVSFSPYSITPNFSLSSFYFSLTYSIQRGRKNP